MAADEPTSNSFPTPATHVSPKQWVAVIAAALGAFMAVLDIQITNSSLPDIQGALGAGLDEGTWISTAYLVAEIITIPLTAWLARVFSIRWYVIVNACLFVFFSMCCAWSWDLQSMIAFRALQGFTGGTLIPMAFTIILTSLPRDKQPIGMALFAVTATFAPSIGPAIGGWLTDNLGWKYIFYMNLIPGLIMIALQYWALPRSKMDLSLIKKGDWLGIFLMAVGMGSLEIFLEEGNRKDWFGSELITQMAITAVISLTLLIWHELRVKDPLLQLRLLARRNFGIGSIANVVLGCGLYGSIFLLPLYLAQIQNYSASQIGQTLMWMGLPQLLIIPLVPKLMKKFDPRILVGCGMLLFGLSSLMNSTMTHDNSGVQLIPSMLIRALGQPLIMVPLSTLATSGIEAAQAGSASALFNMMRNLGGSIGIASISTFLTQREQFHSNRIGEAISLADPETQNRIQSLTQYFTTRGADIIAAHEQALKMLSNLVRRESYVMAFNDSFLLVGSLLLLTVVTVFLLKKPASLDSAGAH